MSSLRRLGDVEWVPLSGDLEGISVGIKHVGMGAVHRWEHKWNALRYRELPRLAKLQATIPEDQRKLVPQLFPETFEEIFAVTEEGVKEDAEIAREILRECVVGIQGHEGDPIEEIERFGLRGIMVEIAIRKQYMKPTDPLVEGGRLLPSDRSPDVGRSE